MESRLDMMGGLSIIHSIKSKFNLLSISWIILENEKV